MASMVNMPISQPLYNLCFLRQSWQWYLSINKIHGEFRSSCTCLQLLYGLHTTPPMHRLSCTRWAGLTGRHLLEFK